MRSLWAALAFASVLPAQDALEIVRRSIEFDQHNAEIARSYTFLQRQQQRELDGSGKAKRTESDTYDITLLEGSQYKRHVAHNDTPLSAKDQAAEEEKLRKSIQDRRKETPEERERRVEADKRKQESQHAPLKEIPEAFDLKL